MAAHQAREWDRVTPGGALPYEDVREEILRVEHDLLDRAAQSPSTCPVCRQTGCWQRSNTDEQKPWTDMECPVCTRPAEDGVLDPCFHSLCQACGERTRPVANPTGSEAVTLSFGRDPEYIRRAAENPRRLPL